MAGGNPNFQSAAEGCEKTMNIRDIANEYVQSRSECVPLVASENSASVAVKALCASSISERYCVGPAAPWRYPCETHLAEIVSRTEVLATRIFVGKKTTVAPLSGSQCVAAIVLGACQPGDVVMGLSAADGGHWALQSMADRLQCRFEPLPLTGRSRIDADKLAELIKKAPPKLVMVDPSHSLETIVPESIRAVLPPGIPLFYDVSHFMGLVPHQYLTNPFGRGITAIHGSTHKSLFGPQKGLIVFGEQADSDMVTGVTVAAEKILSSNTHLHHVAALGQALEEYEAFGEAYAAAVVNHACLFAQTLKSKGLNILSAQNAFTESHHVLVKVAGDAEGIWHKLTAAGILTNLVRPPREDSLGFRFGIAEVTRLGYGAPEIEEAAAIAAGMINGVVDPERAKTAVKELATRPRAMKFCFEAGSDKLAGGRG
jgi:glycine hydroxymethyltransferase